MIITFDTEKTNIGELAFINHLVQTLIRKESKIDTPIGDFEPDDETESGPGEEDGPWAEGYTERSSANSPPIVDARPTVPPAPLSKGLRGTTCEFAALPPDENGNKPHRDFVENTTVSRVPIVLQVTPAPNSFSTASDDEGFDERVVPPEAFIVPRPKVTPPPAPDTQVPPQVSTDTNEGLNDELDSDGKPWDATVHSESRAKNVDGTWRKRRVTKNVEVKQSVPGLEGITPNSVPAPPSTSRKIVTTMVRINGAQNVIKAPEGATDEELSVITGQPTVREGGAPDAFAAANAAPIQPQVTGYQPTAVVGATIPPPPSGGSSVMPPPPPAIPAAPAVIKTAPQGSPVGTFKELMERITQYFSTQQITSQDLAVICATYGIPSIQHSFAKPELVPQIGAALDAFVASRVQA